MDSRSSEIRWQGAVVVVDGVLLMFDVMGIKTSFSNLNKRAIVEVTANTFKDCYQNQQAIKAFGSAWEKAEGSSTNKAFALLKFLKDIDPTTLISIMWALLNDMSWYSIMKSIAVVTATIAASYASSGVAIAIKMGLGLNSAFAFKGSVQKYLQLLSSAS